jgi:hypothetical protein
MAMKKPPEDTPDMQVAIPLGEWMTAMMERDNQMWEKLNSRDERVLGEVLKLFSQVVEATSIDHVVAHGFDEASKQIGQYVAPLRSLGREYSEPGEGVNETLEILHRALKREDFTAVDDDNSIHHSDTNQDSSRGGLAS